MYRLSLIISEIYNKYLPLAEQDGIILNLDFSDTTKTITDPERVKQYLDENLSSALKRSNQGEVTIGVDKTAITITDSGTTLSHSACALLSNRYIEVSSRVGFGTTVKIYLHPRELPAKETTTDAPLEIKDVAISASVDQTATNPTARGGVAVAAQKGKQKLGLAARLQLRGKQRREKKVATAKTKTIKTTDKKSAAKATAPKKSSVAKTVATPSRRQLTAAARKADREVKRIAKKASKQSRKLAKQTKKSTQIAAKQAEKAIKKSAAKAKTKAKTATTKVKKKLELS